MITSLSNPEFLPAILRALNDAKKSIVIVNFLAVMGDGRRRDPVLEIAEALAEAKKRGMAVSVSKKLLEQGNVLC